MKNKFLNFLSRHKISVITLTVVLLFYIITMATGISCPIKYLTGISCAGCGITRACLSVIKLDFAAAFYFHPAWITLPISAFFLIYFKLRKKESAFTATLCLFAFVMLAVYFYRLFFSSEDIVVFSPKDGLIYKLFGQIFHF